MAPTKLEIRNIIKGHNGAYTLMFLLLFSAVLPLGFSLAPMLQITWTADGAPADGMSCSDANVSVLVSLPSLDETDTKGATTCVD